MHTYIQKKGNVYEKNFNFTIKKAHKKSYILFTSISKGSKHILAFYLGRNIVSVGPILHFC